MLIPSVPGRHKVHSTTGTSTGTEVFKNKYGHLKLRDVLHNHFKQYKDDSILTSSNKSGSQYNNHNHNHNHILTLQCSSISSLGKNESFLMELLSSLSASDTFSGHSHVNTNHIKLVWPTVASVKNSYEGVAAGGSLPCAMKVNLIITIVSCFYIYCHFTRIAIA